MAERKKPVTLFDGTKAQGCVLMVGSSFGGPGSCWGASNYAHEEITMIGLDELVPDGTYESEGLQHDFAVITFSWRVYQDFEGGTDVDISIERFIPVTAEQALSHWNGKQDLWAEELDDPEG